MIYLGYRAARSSLLRMPNTQVYARMRMQLWRWGWLGELMTTKPSRSRSRPRSSSGRSLSRPHTALGLTGSSIHRISYSKSLGFDLQGYFRQHGPCAELTVGVNGQPSRDQALLNHVQRCRAEALPGRVEAARVCGGERQGATGRRVPPDMCWDGTEVYNTMKE